MQPSSFFSYLVKASEKLLKNKSQATKDEVRAALEQAYNNANIGPAYGVQALYMTRLTMQ